MWWFGKSKPKSTGNSQVQKVAIRAFYDAEKTTSENKNHWQYVNSLTADEVNSSGVRQTLRNRSRYERENNTYAKGLAKTLANYTIGTGPRLQLLWDDADLADAVEKRFMQWAKTVKLSQKLITLKMAKATDGEAFCQIITNNRIKDMVKLDIIPIECDWVNGANYGFLADDNVDGVKIDEYGNPIAYQVEQSDSLGLKASIWKTVDANFMCHWFNADRPGQHRGIPEFTPALPLFAYLRRYTLATIGAAEIAAAQSLYLETPANDVDGDTESEAEAAPFSEVALQRNTLSILPTGTKPFQLKAEQPVTAYNDFKHEIINEIARCLNVPYNVAAGNSSSYNYASGRLDHQDFWLNIGVERVSCEENVLDKIFYEWYQEAILISDYLPRGAEMYDPADRKYFWPGPEHVDPTKEANANSTEYEMKSTTLAEIYGKKGQDWRKQMQQYYAEKAEMLAMEKALSDKFGTTIDPNPGKKIIEEEKDEAEKPRDAE